MTIEEALVLLYDLKRDKKDSYERPHKPVLLLAILDLIESGSFSNNRIHYSEELIACFKDYFELVRQGNDKPTIQNPFHFLSGDGFWTLVPKSGRPLFYQEGNSGKPSVKAFREDLDHAEFRSDLWNLLADPSQRREIRQALVARYFPDHAQALDPSFSYLSVDSEPDRVAEDPPARMGAFRKIVTKIYDYRCCACGIRVKVDELALVDAAHLVPFSESFNDHPSNGLALCKNHHWAMDRYLLAPTIERRWKVSPRMDSRIPDFKEFLALDGRELFPPNDLKFSPSDHGLSWREAKLLN